MFSESIIFIGLAQSLFASFVIATKKKRGIADWILVACLLTMAAKFAIYLINQQHPEYFDLQFSLGLIPMTFGPYLFLYTDYLISGRTTFRRSDLWHGLPILLLMLMYFVLFHGRVDFTDVGYFNNDDFLWVRIVFGLIIFSSIVVYTTLTFIKLRAYRKSLTEQFSFDNHEMRLVWLNFIFILFVLLFATHFITGIMNAVSYQKVVDTETLSHFGLAAIAFAVSYFGLRQEAFIRGKDQRPGQTRKQDSEHLKQTTDPSEVDKLNLLLGRLNKHMADERPYLNPELTLSELATQININKHTLTFLLNHHLEKNFFTYVNEYRLEAAIACFENPEYNHFTIIAVARDCGFNSKSTFNSLFKKYTGKTPSSYKKAVQSRTLLQ